MKYTYLCENPFNFKIMLTKVIFEYSDGRKKYLDGDELIKWTTFNERVALCAMIRDQNPPWEEIVWKEEGKITENEQKNTKEEDNKENTNKKETETKGT